MQYKMTFRFGDASDAVHFFERMLWGFAFTHKNSFVTRNVRKSGLSSVAVRADTRDDYVFIAVMAMLYESFTGTEMTTE